MAEHNEEIVPDPIHFDFEALYGQASRTDPASAERLSLLRMILGAAEELDRAQEAARGAIALAEELRNHGEEDEAAHLADLAAERANEAERPDLRGEALALLGEIAQRRDETEAAQKFLLEASQCYLMAGDERRAYWTKGQCARILEKVDENEKALAVLHEMPPFARDGFIAMLEIRLLWKLDRKEEALSGADHLQDELMQGRPKRRRIGFRLLLSELAQFLAEAGELERQQQLLEGWLASLSRERFSCLESIGELRFQMARNRKGAGEDEEAARWLAQAIPLLGETDGIGLFEAYVFAAEEGVHLPGKHDPWLAAFGFADVFCLELRLERLGRILGCTQEDDVAAQKALREARRRYRANGNDSGEGMAWRLQARNECKRADDSPTPEGKSKVIGRALRSVSHAMRLARRSGDSIGELCCFGLRSKIHAEQGKSLAATRAAVRAHALAEQLGDEDLLLPATVQLARLRLEAGLRGEASMLLARARLLIGAIESPLERHHWNWEVEKLENRLGEACGGNEQAERTS